jgi:hypothetical protein
VETGDSPVQQAQSEAGGGAPVAEAESRKPEDDATRRMLAVAQFFEDDDMAFVLDRMVSFQNPMRARLASGRYFVRYVVIEDPTQRRSICAALNQWIVSSAEKVTGIGAHFATSLDLSSAPAGTPAPVETGASPVPRPRSGAASSRQPNTLQVHTATPQHLDSGAAANVHSPAPFPSGF